MAVNNFQMLRFLRPIVLLLAVYLGCAVESFAMKHVPPQPWHPGYYAVYYRITYVWTGTEYQVRYEWFNWPDGSVEPR